MNINGKESNPAMSRIAQRGTISLMPETQQTIGIESQKVETPKAKMIYKPPIRSQSSRPNNKSTSTITNSTTNTISSKPSERISDYTDTINQTSNQIVNKANIMPSHRYESLHHTKLQSDLNESTSRYSVNTHKNSHSSIKDTIKAHYNLINKNLNPSELSDFVKNSVSKNKSNYSFNYPENNISHFNVGYYQSNNKPNCYSKKTLTSSNNPINLDTNTYSEYNTYQKNTYSTSTYNSKMPSSYITNSQPLHSNQSNVSSRASYLINLEDLIMLEEKLDEIIYNLNMTRPIVNECFEWWNFYFNCSLCGKFEFYFKEESHKNVIRDCSSLELLIIIICYDASHKKELIEKLKIILKSVLALIHQSFLTLCDYILSKISSESQQNIWVEKLKSLVANKMSQYKKKDDYKKSPNYSFISEIKSNNSCVYDYLRIILKNYNSGNKGVSDTLIQYFKNIGKLNIQILNDFFRSKILRVMNRNASVLASVLDSKEEFGLVAVPYLKTEAIKEYTLVLDLDETLIHFKIDIEDENKGLLRLRPGIYDFLDTVSQFYEVIIFTAATQDYADPILDAIEQDKLYFDYRLYRQHAVIVNNDFVKDISRLGRDLSKTIIIDNMPQNFRLQKENGIFIRTFYGEDSDDSALYDLIPILKQIAVEKVRDVRNSLAKFKNDILKKISSNIEKMGLQGKYR